MKLTQAFLLFLGFLPLNLWADGLGGAGYWPKGMGGKGTLTVQIGDNAPTQSGMYGSVADTMLSAVASCDSRGNSFETSDYFESEKCFLNLYLKGHSSEMADAQSAGTIERSLSLSEDKLSDTAIKERVSALKDIYQKYDQSFDIKKILDPSQMLCAVKRAVKRMVDRNTNPTKITQDYIVANATGVIRAQKIFGFEEPTCGGQTLSDILIDTRGFVLSPSTLQKLRALGKNVELAVGAGPPVPPSPGKQAPGCVDSHGEWDSKTTFAGQNPNTVVHVSTCGDCGDVKKPEVQRRVEQNIVLNVMGYRAPPKYETDLINEGTCMLSLTSVSVAAPKTAPSASSAPANR